MQRQLQTVGNQRRHRRAGHADAQDQQVIQPHIYQRRHNSDDRDDLGLFVVILEIHREGTQEIGVVAGHKNGNQHGASPEIPGNIDIAVHFAGQQHEAHGKHREQLQKIPRLFPQILPVALLHVLEEKGAP